MLNRRKALALACASGLSFPTLAFATAKKPAGDGVLRLGQSTSLSGNGAVGRQFRDAATGWFEHVNAEGGVNGMKIELVTLDEWGFPIVDPRPLPPSLERNARARVNWHDRNFLRRWWQHSYRRSEMLEAIEALPRYIAISRYADPAIASGGVTTSIGFELHDEARQAFADLI